MKIRFWSSTSLPMYGSTVEELHLDIDGDHFVVESGVTGLPVLNHVSDTCDAPPFDPFANVVSLIEHGIELLTDDRSPSTEDLLTLSGLIREFKSGTPFVDIDEAAQIFARILTRYTD